jgi:type I restriction enzyme S subunit
LYFKIPNNWTWIRLGYLGYWGAGATPSKGNVNYYLNGNIPWLVTGDLNDDYIYNIPQKITSEAVSETSVRLNPTGSILIAMYGATIGKLGILTFPATTNQACCACIPSVSINSKFLFYFLMYNRKRFVKNGEGGAQPNISKEKIVSTLMPLPPLNEQNKIVCIIERLLGPIAYYSDLYQKREKLNSELYDKIKKSILNDAVRGNLIVQEGYDEPSEKLLQPVGYNKTSYTKLEKKAKDLLTNSCIFVSDNSYYEKIGEKKYCIDDEIPFPIPDKWTWIRLGYIGDIYTGNSINKEEKQKKYLQNFQGHCYLGTKDIGFDHCINYRTGITIPIEDKVFKIAPAGSILMCIEGGSAGKKVAITEIDVCFGNKLCCIPKNDMVFNKYIYYFLQSELFIKTFRDNISGIIGGVSINKIKFLLVPLPPFLEQKNIAKKIEILFQCLKRY